MAYITADEVRVIRNNLKKAFPEIKFSVRKEHHSSVHVVILESPYDFELNGNTYRAVNHYHYKTEGNQQDYQGNWIKPHTHIDKLEKILDIISEKHWDKSDAMVDYFNCAFYYNLSIGKWDKPYKVVSPKVKKEKSSKPVPENVVDHIISEFKKRGIENAVPKENVLTYNLWKKKNRQVKRGEKGIKAGFYTLFHISQTEEI